MEDSNDDNHNHNGNAAAGVAEEQMQVEEEGKEQEEGHAKTQEEEEEEDNNRVSLVAKWAKERIVLDRLAGSTTIGQIKLMLMERTNVLPKRQKLVGLVPQQGGRIHDDTTVAQLRIKKQKKTHQFIFMGTPEDKIFVDPSQRNDLPDVVDDFDLDFNAGSEEWVRHVANGENLKKFTESTKINVMNEPREGKPLMVLDLDHTLLDFNRKVLEQPRGGAAGAAGDAQRDAEAMKRPHMDEFLTTVYRHYDLVVWSQTSWRWLETKLIELGMLTNRGYRFCFVLDKTSMFAVRSTRRDGTFRNHHVKPLQIIWSHYPDRWGPHNTVHLDDLSRNFALNASSGLRVTRYFRKRRSRDTELVGLGRYLETLATQEPPHNFASVDFGAWQDVVAGKKTLQDTLQDNHKNKKKDDS